MSYVYVLADGQGNRKVGHTKHLERRVEQIILSTPNPCDIELSYSHPRAHRVERALHKILADTRVRGEWFRCDLDRIKLALPMAHVVVEHERKKGQEDTVENVFKRRLTVCLDAAQHQGVNIAEVARRAEIGPSVLYNYKSTGRQPPNKTLVALCKVLGTHPDFLLGFSPDREWSDIEPNKVVQLHDFRLPS